MILRRAGASALPHSFSSATVIDRQFQRNRVPLQRPKGVSSLDTAALVGYPVTGFGFRTRQAGRRRRRSWPRPVAGAEMSAHNEAGRRPASPAPPPHTEQDEDDSHDQQALLHKSEDPSRAKQPSRTLDMLVTLTYCLVYLLVGPALILVNKKIMKVCSYTLSN